MDSNSEQFGEPWRFQSKDNVSANSIPNKDNQQFEALTRSIQSRSLDSNSLLTHEIKNIQNIHKDTLMTPSIPNQSSAMDFSMAYHDNGMGLQTASGMNDGVNNDIRNATVASTNTDTSTKSDDAVSSNLACTLNNSNSLSSLKTANSQLVSVQDRLPSINESFLRKNDHEMKCTPTSVLKEPNIQDHGGLWGRNMFHIENFVRNLSDAVSKNALKVKQEICPSGSEYKIRDSTDISLQNVSVPSTSEAAPHVREENISSPLVSSDIKEENIEQECHEEGIREDSEDTVPVASRHSEQEVTEENVPGEESLDEEKSLMKADYTEVVPVGPAQCVVDKLPDSITNDPSKTTSLGKNNIRLELRVKCNYCKNTFKNEARLRTHVNKFHSALLEKSSEINTEQVDVKEDNGSKNIEGNKTDDNDEYICPVCDKKLDSKSILLLHINSRHVLDRLRICLECAKMFESQESLEEHIKQEHADSNLYSMIFNKRPKLMPTDVTKKRVKTTNKSTSKEPNETGFQRIKGPNPGDLVYQCVKCSSTFPGEEAIQEHFQNDKDCMLKKAVEHKHSCPICKKTLKTNIAEHMRTHSDERPYECTICFSRFKRGHQLKMHVQSLHSDEAKFQCEICGRRFKRKDKLSCHYRSHTDDHPYMCTECGNVFKWKHHVKRHMMTVHQNIKRKESMKRHPCHICGKSFTWGHHVKRHLRNVHQVDTSNMGKFSNQVYRHRMIADIKATFQDDAHDRDESMEESMDMESEGNDSKNDDTYVRSAQKGDESDDYDDDESTDDNKDNTASESRTSLEESNEKLRQLAEAVCREAESLIQNSMTKDTSKEPQATDYNLPTAESGLQNPVISEITKKEPQPSDTNMFVEEEHQVNPVTERVNSIVAQLSDRCIDLAESCIQEPVTTDTIGKVHAAQPAEENVHMAKTSLQNQIVTADMVTHTDTLVSKDTGADCDANISDS